MADAAAFQFALREVPLKPIVVAVAVLAAGAAHAADPSPLTVERVTLATGGLALLEGRPLSPTDTVTLSAEREHVADVLRTLLVRGDTAVAAVDLVGAEGVSPRTPVGRLLADGFDDPLGLLRAAIGETITIRGGPNQLTGTLLGFSEVALPAGENEESRPALSVSVLTASGEVARTTFALDASLDISGAALDALLADAVPALREARNSDRRTLSIRLANEGLPSVSFVIPTTVWRPSYRVMFAGDGPATLQGWATLENTTGFDWADVDLRLAVGTPVAYAQDVYAPLRVSRPNAPFAVGDTLETDFVVADAVSMASPAAARGRSAIMRAEAAPMDMQSAAAEQVGADSALSVFDVPGEVDLGAGRTLSVPFIQSGDVVSRGAYLSLDGSERVMDALLLDATDGTQLPGGLIAVYGETGYLGDARFAGSGTATQIVPFAIASDLGARVTRDNAITLSDIAIGNGVLRVTQEASRLTSVAFSAETARSLTVDAPIQRGEALAASLGAASVQVTEHSPSIARLTVEVPAGETVLDLVATRTLQDQIVAGDITLEFLRQVLAEGGALPERARASVETLAETFSQIAALERQIRLIEEETATLRASIELDRETLQAVNPATPEGAQMRRRLIERTDTIDALLQEQSALRDEVQEMRDTALR